MLRTEELRKRIKFVEEFLMEEYKRTQEQRLAYKIKTAIRKFAYSFKMLDIKTWLYVAYGMSLKSEKDAFDKAYEMLSETGGFAG